MQAVHCEACKRLVGIGDYGDLRIAPAALHATYGDEEGFGIACPVESASDKDLCPGSEMLGRVIEYPRGGNAID